MEINLKSLHGRLLNVAREQGLEFQLLLHRLGAEQFLFRLSQSPHQEKFIFKGGSLLSYIIETDRKTRDLDFSVKQLKNLNEELPNLIKSILEIPADDGIIWGKIKYSFLKHPEMEYPGTRIICDFLLGDMKGQVRIDLAVENVVKPIKLPLKRIRYKGTPLIGEDFELLVYPPEAIFSEKLQIAIKRGAQNTRMKDYYDLYKLSLSELSKQKLKESIRNTFEKRKTKIPREIDFDPVTLNKLQELWTHYSKKQRLKETPERLAKIIELVNKLLRSLNG